MGERTFTLDAFQVEAIDAIDRGDNVLVAAPTGAGKTVVAEHAVQRALNDGDAPFTPLRSRHSPTRSTQTWCVDMAPSGSES